MLFIEMGKGPRDGGWENQKFCFGNVKLELPFRNPKQSRQVSNRIYRSGLRVGGQLLEVQIW